MHYICYKCGEIFDLPFYKKDRYGRHVPSCPACGDTEDIEEELDDEDNEWLGNVVEYEELED